MSRFFFFTDTDTEQVSNYLTLHDSTGSSWFWGDPVP